MSYARTREVAGSFDDVLARTKTALAAEGFGVLVEIDVQATMKQKLDADYEPYMILGACEPSFAHRALSHSKSVGLLLPCNVIVCADGGRSFVSAILPTVALRIAEDAQLATFAEEVEAKLCRAVDAVAVSRT